MQIDLYPASHEITAPLEDLLALLHQQGFRPTKSMVEGSVICPLSEKPFEAFLTAIRQWNSQRPGRQAKPDEVKLIGLRGEDPTLTITVHPSTKTATTAR